MMSYLLLAQTALTSAGTPVETYSTLTRLIEPFIPAITISVSVVIIELVAYWTHQSTQVSWWFVMSLLIFSVCEVIWRSWSGGTSMRMMVDSPEPEGLRLRLQLIGFAALSLSLPALMLFGGVRQVTGERTLSSFAILLARLAASPAIVILLLIRFRIAIASFSDVRFRLFY